MTAGVRTVIAICTWNRAESLRRTLSSLAQLRLPAGDAAVIVVDNASTDHTATVVAEASLPFAVTCVREEQRGLSHARNRAVLEAKARGADLLVFTDDDVEVEPGWLQAYDGAARAHPEIRVFGGPVTPVFATTPAGWMQRNMAALRGPFVYVDHGPVDRELGDDGDMPFGANMAYRISALPDHPFDPALGVAPGRRMGGEETDLSRRLLASSHAGWLYVAGARVRHHLPERAVSPEYLYMHLRTTGQLSALDAEQRVRSALWPSQLPPRWLLRQYATTWLLRRAHWFTRNRTGAYATLFSHEAILRGQIDMYTRSGHAGGQYAR